MRTFLISVIIFNTCHGCLFRSGLSKEDCEDFDKNDGNCQSIYQGRLQAVQMTADLYKSISRDVTVDQANMLLFPIEIARIISILIHGTDHEDEKTGALEKVGCYISKTNAELMASIQIGYFDQDYEYEDSDEDETKSKKKMLSLQRKAFYDTNLSANETFSKKALCWYDLSMIQDDFDEKEQVTNNVNEWANESVMKSKKAIDRDFKDSTFHPLAGHSGVFANDKIIVAASSYVKIPWANNLFFKTETQMDETFIVSSTSLHQNGRKVGIKVPMMHAKGKFKVLENDFYTAVALPLDSSYIDNGDFILILPKPNKSLFNIEEQITSSGVSLFSILEHFLSYKLPEKIVEVSLPRLSIQIMHEWTTPANKKIVEIVDDKEKPLEGDYVGVYQDVLIDMTETEDNGLLDDDIDAKNAPTELKIKANRPFMFIIKMDHELLALGRIQDPLWCKFCPSKRQEYILKDDSETDTLKDYNLEEELEDLKASISTTLTSTTTKAATKSTKTKKKLKAKRTTTELIDDNETTTSKLKDDSSTAMSIDKKQDTSTLVAKSSTKQQESDEETTAKSISNEETTSQKANITTSKPASFEIITESEDESEGLKDLENDAKKDPITKEQDDDDILSNVESLLSSLKKS